MEKLNGFSSDRNVLCLFDVDGTLTRPREVSSAHCQLLSSASCGSCPDLETDCESRGHCVSFTSLCVLTHCCCSFLHGYHVVFTVEI